MVRSIRAEVIVPGLKFYEDWLAKSGNGWFGSKVSNNLESALFGQVYKMKKIDLISPKK